MENYDNDDDWDDLDDDALEQCVLKENEILSQNPELCKNVLQQNLSKPNSQHWISSNFNSFVDAAHTFKAEGKKLSKSNSISEKQSSGSLLFNRPFSVASKKSYKPLPIEIPSTVLLNENRNKLNGNLDLESLQSQLEHALKEKTKLEEENLVKQGEVLNLRCELKRKESSLEAERVDQCIALEAAEKRGKEKATKTVSELELKVKKLEREVDRLEGNILFKNREIDELLAKCKQSNTQSSTSAYFKLKCNSNSPSPKKRKLDNCLSPPRTSYSFADRFDFGEDKKIVKSVQVQTEKELKLQNCLRLKIISAKGSVSGGRKAFYLLSNHKRKNEVMCHENNLIEQNNFLTHLISAVDSTHKTNLNDTERLLVKHVCDNLQNLMNAMHLKGDVRKVEKKYEENLLLASVPLLKILKIVKTDNKTIIENEVNILARFIDEFLKEENKNTSGIVSVLDSLSSILITCSELTQKMCTCIAESLSKCCEVYSIDILSRMISILHSGISHEIFRRKIYTHTAGSCLLNSFCNMFGKVNGIKPENIINEMSVLISRLLLEPSVLLASSSCSCSFSLLSLFINNLRSFVKNITKEEEWHRIFNGFKVLHAWQNKDKHLLERSSQLSTFSLLLSEVTKKAKLLKLKGILDNFTCELIYEIYEIDESS